MSADALLSRLEKVRKVGNGKWMACCPAHADKSASLSIRETDDGRVLVHCFAQCGVDEVLGSLGMDASALFPPREQSKHFAKGKPSLDPFQALRALADDAVVVLVACRMALNGESLTENDMNRLSESAGRFQDARTFVMGGRHGR